MRPAIANAPILLHPTQGRVSADRVRQRARGAPHPASSIADAPSGSFELDEQKLLLDSQHDRPSFSSEFFVGHTAGQYG